VRWNDHLLDGLATTATVSRSRFGAAERIASIVVGEELAGFERQLSTVSRRMLSVVTPMNAKPKHR